MAPTLELSEALELDGNLDVPADQTLQPKREQPAGAAKLAARAQEARRAAIPYLTAAAMPFGGILQQHQRQHFD